ncbi:SpoIIE family protein phosphatase [Solidesulfovibrio alcoholivorans]|uniref:SpoIIE family protein phosphatase n=1 Tax=Solidesulfovibrio alcoholivorans TaxID=81406 RepID=UPI00049782A8|nr:SpoIIE family protein phosphatase [Solidesulfovibrio alcoholivorans]
MRIRWKLFWLLAAISLAPLLLLRVNSQFALDRLSERLSAHVAAHLVEEAQKRLLRLVEDHARLFDAKRQALSLAVALQARDVTDALGQSPSSVPAAVSNAVVLAMDAPGMGMRGATPAPEGFGERPGYFRLSPDGAAAPLPVDPARLTVRLPQGVSREDPRIAALGATVGPLREVAALAGPLAHFQLTTLADGLSASAPATPGAPRRYEPLRAPWYLAAMSAPGPVWSSAQAEPGTGRVCVAVSMRLAGASGQTLGGTAILTPLDDLLASVTPPKHLPGEVETMLVVVAPDTAGAPRLMAQAGELRHERGHGWHAFVTPAPLVSPDAATLAALTADVASGVSGVRRLRYAGRDCLAAYAPTAKGEALLQVAPVAELLATSRAVAAEVEAGIRRLTLVGTAIVVAVMLLLVIVSLSASRAVTRPVLALTSAARRLADGDFSTRVAAAGGDELAALGRVFNELAPRLDAHMRLCESASLAGEIQRSLLPASPPPFPGLTLAGASRYCDETGGDYFDFLTFDGDKSGILGVALGDVSGHGLPAALLMATARALLRPRAARPGTPGEIVADVNRELVRDVYGTGRFMTLFYLEADPATRKAAFARGGHDPALRYDPATGQVDELTTRGMALGVAEEARYETGVAALAPGQTVLIGTDGLWEAENPAGEMFGKARTRDILAESAAAGPRAVCDALFAALDAFRGDRPLEDDVTLVVLRLDA